MNKFEFEPTVTGKKDIYVKKPKEKPNYNFKLN